MFTCVRIKDVDYYRKVRNESSSSRTGYYAGQEEHAQGTWLAFGDGLCGIQNESAVHFDDLEQLAAGCDPRTGQPLLKSTRIERSSGYDLQLAPSKSVSVAWCSADAVTRAKIEACGAAAVRDAMAFIHSEGLIECRRGQGGRRREAASGWLAATFQHVLSRAGDPQLHWHCVVPNAALRADMTTGGIDSRSVLLFARAVGARFNTALAAELRRELGWHSERSEDGRSFELVGLNGDEGRKICDRFSKRRAAVVDSVSSHGTTTADSRQAARYAALNTRGSKADLPPLEQLEERWRDELADMDWTMPAVIEAINCESRAAERQKPNYPALKAAKTVAKAALAALETQEGVFERRHLLRELYETAQTVVAPESAATALAELEANGRIVALGPDEHGRAVYSTPSYIASETRMLDAALSGRGGWNKSPDQIAIESAIAERGLSEEQADAVRAALSSDMVSIVLGSAGTGKSKSLGAVTAAVRDATIIDLVLRGGMEVHAIAPSWKATEVIRSDTETREEMARAVAGFVSRIRDGRIRLGRNSVVILDEGSLVPTVDMSAIVTACTKASCKLIISGDVAQLQAVSAGSPLRLLAERLGVTRITRIRRQHLDWQREASMMLAEGKIADAVAAYDSQGRIGWHADRHAAVAALVTEWTTDLEAEPDGDRLALAATHAECADLNESIRAVERAAGRLAGPDFELMAIPKAGSRSGKRSLPSPIPQKLATNDRIIFGESVEIGGRVIRNADMATVVGIHRDADGEARLTVILDKDRGRDDAAISGRWSQFVGHRRPGEPAVPRLSLGHAITVHSAQGLTQPGKIYVLSASAAMGRESLYVALTRHRADVSMHVDEGRLSEAQECATQDQIKATAVKQWSRSERKRNVADFQSDHAHPHPSALTVQAFRKSTHHEMER